MKMKAQGHIAAMVRQWPHIGHPPRARISDIREARLNLPLGLEFVRVEPRDQ